MTKFRDLLNDQLVVCTTCGAVVEDQGLHTDFHRNNGDPESLTGLGGANAVPPLPARTRMGEDDELFGPDTRS